MTSNWLRRESNQSTQNTHTHTQALQQPHESVVPDKCVCVDAAAFQVTGNTLLNLPKASPCSLCCCVNAPCKCVCTNTVCVYVCVQVEEMHWGSSSRNAPPVPPDPHRKTRWPLPSPTLPVSFLLPFKVVSSVYTHETPSACLLTHTHTPSVIFYSWYCEARIFSSISVRVFDRNQTLTQQHTTYIICPVHKPGE